MNSCAIAKSMGNVECDIGCLARSPKFVCIHSREMLPPTFYIVHVIGGHSLVP